LLQEKDEKGKNFGDVAQKLDITEKYSENRQLKGLFGYSQYTWIGWDWKKL
jgi:hypothetical protein